MLFITLFFQLLLLIPCQAWNSIPITRNKLPLTVSIYRNSKTCFFSTNGVTSTVVTTSNKETKLSRSERKAIERELKKQKLRRKPPKKSYSDKLFQISNNATHDELFQIIKRAQQNENHKCLIEVATFLEENTITNSSLLSRTTVAALHFSLHSIANKMILLWQREKHNIENNRYMESAAIIRALIRSGNISDAWNTLEDELPVPVNCNSTEENLIKEQLKYRASSLSYFLIHEFYDNQPIKAISTCQKLMELGPLLHKVGDSSGQKKKVDSNELIMPWIRMIKAAAQCESKRRNGILSITKEDAEKLPCNLLYSLLDVIIAFPLFTKMNDQSVMFEMLSNAFIRRTDFVISATNMDQLPKSDRGEVVFIGRSNVGKSSLVNAITNRKALAYTSKQPGKTKQFNYFAINDKPDVYREIKYGDVLKTTKDLDSFYVVDVPGYGYAHSTSQQQREEWITFFEQYVTNRKKSKVIFHLIDSRHGPLKEDGIMMTFIRNLVRKPDNSVQYVIILTKADKNVRKGRIRTGHVSEKVLDNISLLLKQKWGSSYTSIPIILSSAETKLGADQIWKYLKLAAQV